MFLRLLKWLWHGIAIIDLMLFSILMYPLAYLPAPLTRRFYHRWFRYWCKLFVHALDIDLRLHEHFDKPLPDTFILIANHPSIFEDIGIPALFDTYPVAKEAVKHWPVGGHIAQAAGTLFVRRDSEESRKAVSDEIARTLSNGKSIAIFPEGGCKGKRIHAFRWGIFEISLNTGVPIVPVFLHYEAQDAFAWGDEQTAPQKIWQLLNLPNNRANYHVFDPLYPQDFKDKASYCEHAHQMYLHWQEKYLD